MGTRVELRWGTRQQVSLDGVPVHVEHAGEASASRPLIGLLHGFASGTFTWSGVASDWATGGPVVAWDRPPFGRSGRPAPLAGAADPYRLEAELVRSSAVIEAHLKRSGAPGVVLVGHSAGALLAVQLTMAADLPVKGLVLLAPALAGSPPEGIRRLASLPGAGRIGAGVLGVALRGARPALRMMSAHPSDLMAATAAETARCLRRAGTARALWHLTATWSPPQILDDLGPLGVPTMVIGGADDRISTPGSTADLAARLEADLHLLDDVGHAPHEQVPEVVGPLVGAFVEGLDR